MTQNTHAHPSTDSFLNFIEEAEKTQTNPQKQDQQTQGQQSYQHVLLRKLHNQFRVVKVKDDFYFKDQSDQIVFKDKGKQIVSALHDDRVTQAMVTLAQAKGWKSIKVSGHLDFQRKIWMEANKQGIEVHGYNPTEQELDKLHKSRRSKSENTVEKASNPAIDLTTSKPSQQNDQDKDGTTSSQRTSQTEERIYKGRLLDHGEAKYNYDENENSSYYIKLASKYGERTVWGIDLSRAIAEGGVEKGDDITVKFVGKEDVRVEVPTRDKTGQVTGSEWIDTQRNTWDVKKSDEVKIVEAVATTFIDAHIKNPQHREILKRAIEDHLSEREKIGKVPNVAVYDKIAHSKEPEQAQTTPNPQHNLERTR